MTVESIYEKEVISSKKRKIKGRLFYAIIPNHKAKRVTVNATVRTDRPPSKQVAKYSRYNNGTNNIMAGTDRLPGNS